MAVLLILAMILIAVVFGKSGVAFLKGLLMLSFGALLLMAGCAIV